MTTLQRVRLWGTRRQTAESGGPLWLGLGVAILLLMPAATPAPIVVACLLLLVGTLALSLRFPIGAVVLVVLVMAGIVMRLAYVGVGYSDVLPVTDLAIDRMLAGGNPYGIGYSNSIPPGAPFAYGPLSLLWYLPAPDPRRWELAVSIVILLVLAVRGRPIGLAVYALAPTLLSTASDGSNDTSAGLFLLVAMVAAERDRRAGGVLLAAAAAFKPYSAAWVPGLVVWGGIPAALGFVAGSVVFWGPALIAWGPGAMLESLRLAERIHAAPYYSLGYVVEFAQRRPVSQETFDRLRLGLGAAAAAVTWPFVRSHRSMVMAGVVVYLVTLYSGYWSTFAYVSAIMPVICWYLDDWIGLGRGRVAWPGDPVGRLTRWVDRRWPATGRGSVAP